MEVKIGVQNVAREVIIDTPESKDALLARVEDSMREGKALVVADEKGRMVIVPAAVVAYVELGAEENRRVGFGGGPH